MRMRARPLIGALLIGSFAVYLRRKIWMKGGGGGENGSALLFGASLALRLWFGPEEKKI